MSNKIKQCKVCGKDIATSAKVCPCCGAKNKKPIYKRWWFILLVVLIVLSIIGSLGGADTDAPTDAPSKVEEKEPEIEYTEYTVNKLIGDLEKNAAKAQDKYEGKYVELTGELSVIDSDGKYIALHSDDTIFTLADVQCYIKGDEQLDKVKEMEIGDTVTVKGKITDVGEIMGYELKVDSIK